MNSISPYVGILIKGTWITLASWLCAGVISFVVGTFLGVLTSEYFSAKYKFLNRLFFIIKFYTFVVKGIPAYVQILILYFMLPISGFVAGSIALGVCSSGYVSEIIRSGINAVPQGQWDACFVLGYSLKNSLKRIIFPQAFRIIVPALLGECEQLLKSTSLLATIGVTELTRSGMNIISRELNPVPVYCILACVYLFFSALMGFMTLYYEKRMRHGRN